MHSVAVYNPNGNNTIHYRLDRSTLSNPNRKNTPHEYNQCIRVRAQKHDINMYVMSCFRKLSQTILQILIPIKEV
jgi:rRNA-processing protein FCF1